MKPQDVTTKQAKIYESIAADLRLETKLYNNLPLETRKGIASAFHIATKHHKSQRFYISLYLYFSGNS